MTGEGRSPAQYTADIEGARDRLIAFVESCTAGEDLKAGDGRIERLAQIAIRHADDHRTEIEAALATPG